MDHKWIGVRLSEEKARAFVSCINSLPQTKHPAKRVIQELTELKELIEKAIKDSQNDKIK